MEIVFAELEHLTEKALQDQMYNLLQNFEERDRQLITQQSLRMDQAEELWTREDHNNQYPCLHISIVLNLEL